MAMLLMLLISNVSFAIVVDYDVVWSERNGGWVEWSHDDAACDATACILSLDHHCGRLLSNRRLLREDKPEKGEREGGGGGG